MLDIVGGTDQKIRRMEHTENHYGPDAGIQAMDRAPRIDMDLFKLISTLNPSKVKTGLRPHAAHEVPLLTATTSQVIDMEDPDVATESSGTPSAIEKSTLDFDYENPSPLMTEGVALEVSIKEEVAAMGPRLSTKCRRRVNDVNAPPKVLRKDYASVRPEQSTHEGKTLPTMGLAADSTFVTPADTKGVSDPDPLSYAEPQPHPEQSMTQEIDLLLIHGWVTQRYLSARMRRDQQLSPRHPERMPRCCRSHSAAGQLSTLQTQVTGKEQITAAFEEFKIYEDDRVEKRCVEMDACLDASSIDFDEELYPHMLTAIAGCQWVIGHGLRLAVMKCAESIKLRQAFANVVSAGIAKGMSEGLEHGIEHGNAGRDLEVIEAYDPEANNKYLQALQELKNLKYPIVDQLEGLKDALIEVIMASDFREDAPKWIRDLFPITSQIKIHVYLKVHDPRDPWAVKEEMLLEEAIAANVSNTEKKKRCRVVYHTHGAGSAHYARSYGVPVSVPTVAPQGLVILLADTATRTETSEDDASPRLLRSKSLPPMYYLDWP
nr:transposase (putative), gypsy type [Tanacetum cinerariifolium]